jgi:hypothetical protein
VEAGNKIALTQKFQDFVAHSRHYFHVQHCCFWGERGKRKKKQSDVVSSGEGGKREKEEEVVCFLSFPFSFFFGDFFFFVFASFLDYVPT